jgi:tRNA pseudouridine65 synthase
MFEQPLEILYQDQYMVAINKPAGLLVHKTYLARKEKYFAMLLLRDQLGQYVYPIHRLDRPTSGVLLFALSSEVARQLNDLFSERQVAKGYLAIVRGYLQGADVLDYALKEQLDKIADKKANQDKEPQEAVTRWANVDEAEFPQPIGKYPTGRFSLIALAPQTGRKHQLRRHLAHLRHPILGDTTHGDGAQNRYLREHFGYRRMMLHAATLQFTHPITGQEVVIEAPLDQEFSYVCQQLGWSEPMLDPLAYVSKQLSPTSN